MDDGFQHQMLEPVRRCWAAFSRQSGRELTRENADFGEIRVRFLVVIRRVLAVPIMAAEDVAEHLLRVRPQGPVPPHVRPLRAAEGIVAAVARVAEAVVAVVAADERLTVFGEEV